ncbi:hypothetical protein [Nostoc sp. CCY 9925]|uniref:hypothetical protein n=1 Tax=Nostoc sp. CCY 9925 TaxID=3103865 RepID=UPI0039C7436B
MSQPSIPFTEFGEKIREIYKKPHLPESVLPESRITPEDHQNLIEKWSPIIEKKNSLGSKKGLSLDEFTKLITDFFGYQIINRSLIDRLIHTGNPYRENHAKVLKENNLRIISYFTNNYSYAELRAIALKILGLNQPELDQPNLNQPQQLLIVEDNKEINLKALLLDYLNKNGYRNLDLNPSDLLEILFEDNPKVEIRTLLLLPDALGIPKAEFLKLLEKEI